MTYQIFRSPKLWLLSLVLFFLTATEALAQKDKEKEKQYAALLEKAEYHLLSDEYDEAIPFLLDAYKLKPNADCAKQLSDTYYLNKQYGNMLPYLELAKAGGLTDKDYAYRQGLGLHAVHKFDEAIQSFTQFKSTLKAGDERIPEVDRYIKYCQNGKELVKNPVKVKIKNLGPVINSKYPDYVPAISADETVLVFTSRRKGGTGDDEKSPKKDPQDNQYFEDIYISVKADDTTWTTPQILAGSGINTESHDAAVGLSPDGQELFIYKVTGKDGGDLYQSTLVGSVWSAPKNLGPNINTASWEPSASTTSDEKVLFFTSDKKGGFGGRDIYMAKVEPDAFFALAVYLGPNIPPPLAVDAPFIHADGKTLYFSSKGHTSMGGFDIFYCTINTETGDISAEPKNIGYPINTSGDDVFFVWSADNKRAYFSSAREGGYGDKDLYLLERDEAKSELVVFKGTIMSCEKDKAVGGTILVTDLGTGKAVGIYTSNVTTGKYTVILPAGKNYAITVEAPGYAFYSKNINIPHLDHYVEMKDSICLDPLEIGTVFVLNNVFFDVDKATLRPESLTELDRLYDILLKNPSIRIRISGHTDSDGSEEHNLKLSDSRAHAVKDFLVAKGIAATRLEYKGFGEGSPVKPNDTPENKQLNRRTEIEVIK